MGWFDFNSDKQQKAEQKAETTVAPAETPKPSTSAPATAEAPARTPTAVPRPTSTFEFGPLVAGGSNYMRGNCAGENPDAVQACTWTIEPLPVKPREKRHLYRIEF